MENHAEDKKLDGWIGFECCGFAMEKENKLLLYWLSIRKMVAK